MPGPAPRGWRDCERCGVKFQRRWGQSVVAFNRIRFCSMACNNRSRIKHDRMPTLPQLAVIGILVALEDEHGIPLARHVAQRYYALRGEPVPTRKDGQPDVQNVQALLVRLVRRGWVRHRGGKRGTREGAFVSTPAGRAALATNTGGLVRVAVEPAHARPPERG